jgi:type VI secretion system protein ImpE
MTVKELIQAGRLADAREQLNDRVRNAPTDTGARFLLFQVLAYQGEWERAEKHLELLVMQAPANAPGFLAYRSLLAAEKLRAGVAAGSHTPDFMTEPPAYYADLIAARQEARENQARAAELFDRVVDMLPEVSGTADGAPFACFVECDATLAGILEVFVHDRYLWFPFQMLRELSIPQPKSFLDLLWTPARIVTWEGLTTECFLPALYAGSFRHEDVRVQLGRMTDWLDLGGCHYQGVGQHLLQVGDEERGLLELREVTFNPPKTEVSTC